METRDGDHAASDRRRVLAQGCALAGLAMPWLALLAATPGPVSPPSPASPGTAASGSSPVGASASLALRTAAQAGSPAKYGSGDPQRPGLCAEIAAAVLRVDPDLRLDGLDQQVPLRRLELMLGNGDIDVFFCLLASEHRRALMRFLPVPLYRVRHVLAMRTSDARNPRNWDELRAFARRDPLLLAQGTKLSTTLQQADVAFQETARSDRDALQMLMRGRAGAVYGQDINLRHALRASGLEQQIRIGSLAFEEDVQYAVVSRQLPDAAADRVTERLRQLTASGEIARLVERYR